MPKPAKELTIRITGEAGQGIQSIGTALQQIVKNCGLNIFSNQDYMSRIRGGNNYFQVRIADRPIFTLRGKADIIVALAKNSSNLYKDQLSPQGIFISAPEVAGKEIYINSLACGIIGGITQIPFQYLSEVIAATFARKEDAVIEKNIKALQAGYDYGQKNFQFKRFQLKIKPAQNKTAEMLLNGNEAIALGAVRAGCKFYSGYPMTPSTEIMEHMAKYLPQYNGVVEQAEDEIAAVNMVIGASFAGVRAMTATSGGGFCLMAEGLSLAGMTETPIVIVDAQRPAPATGFPTRTEQADLDFMIHAGHGEFARVIYTPGTSEEAFYLTGRAFNIAEKYQLPVIIMTDQHLADSYRNIKKLDPAAIEVKRSIISKVESVNITNYKRYQLTKDGISPRGIPSWLNDPIYVDSDEHNEEGHITESAEIRNKMVEKRFYKKMAALEKEIVKPVTSKIEKAKTILLGFGSNYGVLKEVIDSAPTKKLGFIHLPQVWPFPATALKKLLKGKKVFTLENNAGAQLAKLLKRETGITVQDSFLKYDGRPFDLDYVLEKLKEVKKI